MASSVHALTVLERCRVAPPPGSVVEASIPLSFFDLPWITFPPIHQLIFYDLPRSKSHFVETIVPQLKHSLSLTLQHYYPLAGNLIVSSTCTNSSPAPEIRYLEGDSVPLTIAESNEDFVHLTGHHARDANQFHPLVPHLGRVDKTSDDVIIAPLLAIQVTIFPDAGICIGLTSNHVACDGNARVRFIRAWASINKFGGDEAFLASGSLPFFDRSLMKDSNNIEAIYWNNVKEIEIAESPLKYRSCKTNNVRSSFILPRAQINLLKKTASAKLPKSAYITSFSVLCAHVWSCLAKMRAIATIGDDDKDEDELEQFHCVADYRARLDPPIPESFFGNCLGLCFTTAKRSTLLGDDGFSNAAMLIGEAIGKMLGNKEEMHLGGEMYIKGDIPMPPTMLGVTGSPKFNIYSIDFGFGKAKKVEFSSTDFSRSMSVTVSKESEDDLEIGLSLPKAQMEAFAVIFSKIEE